MTRLSFIVSFLEGRWISADFGAELLGKPNGRGPSEDVQLGTLTSADVIAVDVAATFVGGVDDGQDHVISRCGG